MRIKEASVMKKKYLFVVLALSASLLTGCFSSNNNGGGGSGGDGGDKHTHTVSREWSKDDTYHWKTCLGCDEQIDKEKHIFEVREIAATYEEKGRKLLSAKFVNM